MCSCTPYLHILGLRILLPQPKCLEKYILTIISAMAPDVPGFGMLLRLVRPGPAYNGQGVSINTSTGTKGDCGTFSVEEKDFQKLLAH